LNDVYIPMHNYSHFFKIFPNQEPNNSSYISVVYHNDSIGCTIELFTTDTG